MPENWNAMKITKAQIKEFVRLGCDKMMVLNFTRAQAKHELRRVRKCVRLAENPDYQKKTIAEIPFDRKEWYYKVYLRSEHWKDVRTRKFAQVGKVCQCCEATGLLDIHHMTYVRIGHEELSDLLVLCRRCHVAYHKMGVMRREWVK